MTASLPARDFPTTLWTLVLHAGRARSDQADAALGTLCEAYWYPLYSFLRHRGYSAADAEDLTQSFFARILEKRSLQRVDPALGRFRTFLLAALKNFLANDHDRAHAVKRGGGRTVVSLDQERAEARYRLEPSHEQTAERHFERQWALTLLDRVLADLHDEYHRDGKGDVFDELKGAITGAANAYAEIAARLQRSEGAVKVAVHRLRRRYRELMRARIADTVGPGEVDDELRHLVAVLGA